ncbi:MAG: Xaa-Pro peptidase family protein [Spirochaetota bacterium]
MSDYVDMERDSRLRRDMRAAGLKAILAWFPEDLVLTGGSWPCLGMNLCLYPAEGQPVYYLSTPEPDDVVPEGFLARRFPIQSGNWSALRSMLAADLQRLGVAGPGIARDGGQHAVTSFPGETPVFGNEAISMILDGVRTCDANDLFTEAGLRKTPLEIGRIRRANAVAGAGLAAFYAGLRAGASEAEIAAAVEGAIQSRSGKDGCRTARAWAMVQGGENILNSGTFSRSSGNVHRDGDLVLLELGTCVDGYWSDLTRTGCVGAANDRQRFLLKAVKGAQAAAIGAIRPGVTHEAVDAVARSHLEALGLGAGFTHNCGHHVGFRYHDRGPALQKGSVSPLSEGMVITVEPGCYGADFGGGSRFEDNVLVTANGSEVLSPMDITWPG